MAEPYAPDLQPLDYTGYHSIEVRNDTRLRVRITDELETVVDYTGQDLDQLITRQFGEWLRFDRNKRWLIWTNGRQDRFDVSVGMPVVRELKALSGSEITGSLGTQDQFRAEAEGASITLSVDTPSLRLRGNDGATLVISGTCGRLTMLARPTSTVDLTALSCESIVIFGDRSRVALPDGANVVDEHPES